MFNLSNVLISKEKVNSRSINSNRFWFTPKTSSDEFPLDEVKRFVEERFDDVKSLNGKRFANIYHLFMTEAQANFFIAMCPYLSDDSHKVKLINDRLYGHMISVTEEAVEENTKKSSPKKSEEKVEAPAEEVNEEVVSEDKPEEKVEEVKEILPEAKEETSVDVVESKPEAPAKPKKPTKKPTKK